MEYVTAPLNRFVQALLLEIKWLICTMAGTQGSGLARYANGAFRLANHG